MDFYSGVYESPVTLLSRAPGLGSQAGCSEAPVAHVEPGRSGLLRGIAVPGLVPHLGMTLAPSTPTANGSRHLAVPE